MLGAAHSKEFPLPVFVRVLEEGEEDSARDPGKAYPEAFPLLFHLKEMQENVYGREDAQVSVKNLKTPYKRPAVGVELGGGGIDFGEEFSLQMQFPFRAFRYYNGSQAFQRLKCATFSN